MKIPPATLQNSSLPIEPSITQGLSSNQAINLSSGGWNRFNTRSKTCPVCRGARKDCRQSKQTEIIFCRAGVDNPDFKFIGEDRNGFGKFADREKDEADKEAYIQRQKEQREALAKAERERLAASMPIVERHRYFSRLQEVSPSELHPDDLADLIDRGFSLADIERIGFRSVSKGQTLTEQFPANLPGVSHNRRSLLVAEDGYIYPIRNADGLIVAFQLRVRGATENKYRWLSFNSNFRLPDGEVPLAHINPENATRNWTAFSEGTGPKPHLASIRLGCPVIGAAGGNFGSSEAQVKAALESGSIPVLVPDGGAIANPHVMRQYEKLAAMVPGLKVLWWEQWNKGYDIDEISDEVLASARLITWEEFQALDPESSFPLPTEPDTEFLKLLQAREEAEESEYKHFKPIREAQKQQKRDRYRAETDRIMAEYNSLRIAPTVSLMGRYIPQGAMSLPDESGIIIIDAPMGSGKTHTVLKDLINQHRRKHPKAWRCLLVPRNLLGIQSGGKLSLIHHTSIKGFGHGMPNDLTLCPESGWKFPVGKLPDGPPLILLDEVSQLLQQVLEGKTSKQNHALILTWLRDLLKWVKQQGGWIILSEDGVTNLELDFISEASGLDVTGFLKFERNDTRDRQITLFESPSMTWVEIKNRLSNGENLILEAESSAWLRETEREIIKECGVSPSDIWIVDSSSSNEPWAQLCSQNPDKWVTEHKPRVLGYSPSWNSGVSLEDPNGHFHAMAIHHTHLDPRESKQLPERLRTDVPRFGYVKEKGGYTDDLLSGCRPDLIIRDFYRNAKGVEKLTEFATYANSKEHKDSDGNTLDLVEAIAQLKASEKNPDSDFGFFLKYFARYKARGTYNRLSLRDNLIQHWESHGFNVEFIEGIATQEREERQGIKVELAREEANKFAEADTIALTVSDAREKLNDPSSNKDERRKARKRLLEDKLPGIDLNNPEFVLKAIFENNGRFLKTAELLWMRWNPESAKWIDRWAWENEAAQAAKHGSFVSYARLPWRSKQAQILNACPLEPFIDGVVVQWDNNTPEVIAVHQWAVLNRHPLRRYNRLNVSEDHSPVKTVNKLLRQLGYEVEESGWKGGRGDRQRQYIIANLEDTDRDAVLKALDDRFIKRLEEKEGITDPSSPVPVIATRRDITSQTSCDHQSQLPGSSSPLSVVKPQGDVPNFEALPPDLIAEYRKAWEECSETDRATIRESVDGIIAEWGGLAA